MSSFCQGCGNGLSEGERFCGTCGRDSLAASAQPAVDPAVAFGLPPETSGKAIFSLISGLLFIILPFSLTAIIFGHLSLSEIRNSGGRLAGRGLAIAGLVLGYLGVAAIAGFIVWSAIYVRQREKSVAERAKVIDYANPIVSAVRSLNMAEIAYAQGHREAGYTCSLSELRAAWGLSNELAQGQQDGYIFEIKGCTAAKANGPIAKYQIVAYPAATSKAGTAAAFCSNESDVIKVARNGSPQDCLRAGVDVRTGEINRPQNWSKTASR